MVSVAMKPVPPVTRAVLYLGAILKKEILEAEVVDQFLKQNVPRVVRAK
jgi:hypothetical protein